MGNKVLEMVKIAQVDKKLVSKEHAPEICPKPVESHHNPIHIYL
jgi:hypothetical protein